MNINILIAFLNTIRLSAHILIVSADALIVGTHRNKRRRKSKYIQLRESDEFKTELAMCINGSLYIDARLL
nr:hypothetical protein [uncultured Alloprevotella sp.]